MAEEAHLAVRFTQDGGTFGPRAPFLLLLADEVAGRLMQHGIAGRRPDGDRVVGAALRFGREAEDGHRPTGHVLLDLIAADFNILKTTVTKFFG